MRMSNKDWPESAQYAPNASTAPLCTPRGDVRVRRETVATLASRGMITKLRGKAVAKRGMFADVRALVAEIDGVGYERIKIVNG